MIGTLSPVPREISFGWVYFPPLFFAIIVGILAAWILAGVLNHTGLSRFFWRPPVAFLAFVLVFGSLFALFVMAP